MELALFAALRGLLATGGTGFEGLVAELLENLTGYRFLLAQSGSQSGRDMRAESASEVIMAEAKRYGKKSPLTKRDLLGELAEAVQSDPNLDLWVLVATRKISDQVDAALVRESEARGIYYRAISSDGGEMSSLAILCAQAHEVVLDYVEENADQTSFKQIAEELERIPTHPGYHEGLNQLQAMFSLAELGFDSFRSELNCWLNDTLGSERRSRAIFGQRIVVSSPNKGWITRERVWKTLDQWLENWKAGEKPFLLNGEEGDGKTWCVASWAAARIANDQNFLPVVFVGSQNASSNDPFELISAILTVRIPSSRKEVWDRRLRRWLEHRQGSIPSFVLVLDGMNERNPFSWWRRLLEQLWDSPWCDKVALLITVRAEYWRNFGDPLRHLSCLVHTVPPYDDDELNLALSQQDMKRSDFPSELLPLLRKPRYFDMAVKHRERMAEHGDFTVARLVYEDWFDRIQRKNDKSLNDHDFQTLIMGLAESHRRGRESFRTQEIAEYIPFDSEKENTFEELRTGGILVREGTGFKVDEKRLILGFGLLLADQVRQALGTEQNIPEVIAAWLEPHREMDIKAQICGTAVLHSMSAGETYESEARVALLQAWLESANTDPELVENLSAYLPLDPDSYLDLAETVWKYERENRWGQELIVRTLIRWANQAKVAEVLPNRFEKWMGFIHPDGHPLQRRGEGDAEKKRREIAERCGQSLSAGPFTVANRQLTVIEDDGLLRLGRAALAVISHVPRKPYIKAIATGCLAEALMNYADKYDLMRWVLRSSKESLEQDVEAETKSLLAFDQLPTRQACSRLLSCWGSEQAITLRGTLPEDLFPRNRIAQQHQQDPCTSVFTWTREECETCVQRTDIPLHSVATRLFPHCLDADLNVPSEIGTRLAPLVEKLLPSQLWAHNTMTLPDHQFEEIEPTFCAYAPNVFAGLVRRIAADIQNRTGIILALFAWQLRQHAIVLTRTEWELIQKAWRRLHEKTEEWDNSDKQAEYTLFLLLLQHLPADEQFKLLIERPEDRLDLLDFQRWFRPLSTWEDLHTRLSSAEDDVTVRRILWFLSPYADRIPADLVQDISKFVSHADSIVSGVALEIIVRSGNSEAIQSVVEGKWSWSSERTDFENHWGSLLLGKYADKRYFELNHRIHPAYVGYALKSRNFEPSEVEAYAHDIHSVWLLLGTGVPDLPRDLPEVEAGPDDPDSAEPHVMVGLSPSEFRTQITHRSVDAHWGGAIGVNSPDLGQGLSEDPNERAQFLNKLLEEALKEQRDFGNPWFAQAFSPEGLEAIVKQQPHFVEQWLGKIQDDTPGAKKHIFLGQSFYEALCQALLIQQPDQGVLLYRRLRSVQLPISFKSPLGSDSLDIALFQAPDSPDVIKEWDRFLDNCTTDRKLLEFACLIQSGSALDHVLSRLEEDRKSSIRFFQARALTLASFVESLSEELRANFDAELPLQPDLWIEEVLKRANQQRMSNQYAQHWFRKYLTAYDSVEAWAAWRLFLRCVDRRFFLWRRTFQEEFGDLSFEYRWTFANDNSAAIKKCIQKKDDDLEKTYLGLPVKRYEVWPWMG